jgi:ATP-dependent DNA ligase
VAARARASHAADTTGPTASRLSSKPPPDSSRRSFLIEGEAVIVRDDGQSDFNARRSRRRDLDAMLFAFDLIEYQG